MTLGEKILQLRKTNNLSQEQLADKLAVSRQAISKWELGESTPDTDKIILLSRMFEVSTDYLLHDGISSDSEIPAVKTSSELIKKHYNLKTLFIIITGVSIIGLLMSIIAQLTWQTIFTVSIGVAHWRGEGDTVEAILARADMAMYDAKHEGRNRVCSERQDKTGR